MDQFEEELKKSAEMYVAYTKEADAYEKNAEDARRRHEDKKREAANYAKTLMQSVGRNINEVLKAVHYPGAVGPYWFKGSIDGDAANGIWHIVSIYDMGALGYRLAVHGSDLTFDLADVVGLFVGPLPRPKSQAEITP